MGVKPVAEGPAISRDKPGQANLAREAPPAKTYDARLRSAPRRRLSIGRTGKSGTGLPNFCSERPQMRASLGSPTTGVIEHRH